ncbi:MAG TPA: porin, partial [Planctomycetota bacterium]|nr:porin [Planctomycetota bacterium]
MVRILFLWGTAIVLGISGLWSEGATAYAQEGATTDEARAIDGAEENGVALEGEEELSLEERVALLESLLRESKAGDPKTMRFFWDGGPRAETTDGNFKFRLTGRLHNDWAFLSADDEIEQAFGDFQDGVEFRRARVGVQGLLFQHFEFKIQFDFAQGDTDFRDVYGALVN